MTSSLFRRLASPSPLALVLALVVVALAGCAGVRAPAARASTNEESIIEDDAALQANPQATLATFRSLGVTLVKVRVSWSQVAPDPNSRTAPKHFTASDPSASGYNWGIFDTIDRIAVADGLKVGFLLTGNAPGWAIGSGAPRSCSSPCGEWEPNAADFGAFVEAVGRRYSGTFAPAGQTALPAVRWWSVWNEPNYGPDLAPQATDDNTVPTAAIQYRSLVGHAFSSLAASGHTTRTDTILIGETAPRGRTGAGFPGNFSGTDPIPFLDDLYCVDSNERRLTGAAAKRDDCPASAASFRAANPALFDASGYADHPYAQGTPPTVPTYACGSTFCFNTKTHESTPGYADFAELGRLENVLDRSAAADGGHTHFPIWSTEYGYFTSPPDHAPGSLPIATAEAYMNWAEYLSSREPRLASFDQYLLIDAPTGTFGSGLETATGRLTSFDAFQIPLWLPSTSLHRAGKLNVWGDIRPERFATDPAIAIQFEPSHGSTFATVGTVPTSRLNARGYFEVPQSFSRSGTVRLAFSQAGAPTEYSRTQAITVG